MLHKLWACDCKDRLSRLASLSYFWVDLVFTHCTKSSHFYENAHTAIRCPRSSNLLHEFSFLKYVLRRRYALTECNPEIILFYFFLRPSFRSWPSFEILAPCWNILYYLHVNFADLADRSLSSWIGNLWDPNNAKKTASTLKKRILNPWFQSIIYFTRWWQRIW